jgi:MFS family permease
MPYWVFISAFGTAQILAWGTSYYMPAVLAKPTADATGWPLTWVVGGFTLGLLAAGAISPRVGRTIDRHGGRPVLAASAITLAAGLAALGLAPSLPLYVAAWIVIGVGMGAGLYDAAFAALGRIYGKEARGPITTLTLFGGFASTVGWPLGAFLLQRYGWRGTCLVFAAINLLVVFPLYYYGLPRHPPPALVDDLAATTAGGGAGGQASGHQAGRGLFVLVALALTLNAVVTAVISVHLVTILQARDIALAVAVGLGALVGPSQVGARFLEMFFGRRLHPVYTMLISTVLVAAGVGLLLSHLPVVALALVMYGAGMGIRSIARGTMPLALFGAPGYATLMGRLAMPSLLASAMSPSAGAWLIDHAGVDATLGVLVALAIANVALVLGLLPWVRRRPV